MSQSSYLMSKSIVKITMKVKRSDRPTIEQAKLDDIEVLRGESANTSVATSHDSSVVSVPQDMEEEVTVDTLLTMGERPARRRKLEAKSNCVTGKRQLIFENQEDSTGGTGEPMPSQTPPINVVLKKRKQGFEPERSRTLRVSGTGATSCWKSTMWPSPRLCRYLLTATRLPEEPPQG